MKNKEIKMAMLEKGIYQWEVAKAIGVSECTLTRWMREELSEEKKTTIMDAIQRIR